MMMRDDSGQIHTIEGITAALMLLVVLTAVIQSITFVAPQTEKTLDMNLSVMATDILTTLNIGDENHISPLKLSALNWSHGTAIDPTRGYPPSEGGIASLDRAIGEYLPPYDDANTQNKLIRYNVSFFYFDGTRWVDEVVITHGTPYDNTMTVSKIITLNPEDDELIGRSIYDGKILRSGYWNNFANQNRMPMVVEVRLSLWYA